MKRLTLGGMWGAVTVANDGTSDFTRPEAIALGADGTLYVTDTSPSVWACKQSVLVWVILEAAGGRMDATELSKRIQGHRQMARENTMATRSVGLKTLKVLGYAEIDRVASRLEESTASSSKNPKKPTL